MWNNFSQSAAEDESISNAFCTNGIFKIWGDELVYKYPRVFACVQNKKMVIAVDKSVVLLEDENVAKCSFLGFNSEIDAMAISHSGNLIICGLSDGEVHGIFIKGIPLFNLCINQDDIQINKSIVSIQQVGKYYLITCTNGSIYQLSDIDETKVDLYLNMSLKENETVPLDETIMDNVKIKRITKTKILNEVTAVLGVPFPTNEDLMFMMGTKCFLRFQEQNEEIKVIIPDFYQGVKSFYHLDNYTLLLTNSGCLLEICQYTKLVYQNTFNIEYLIDDLTVMENNNATVELLLLTKPNENGSRALKMVNFPSFKCIYEFEMPAAVWLVTQPKCSINLYYLCGESLNVQGMPQEIEMKLISETEPAERLKKLIYKGHMEEAEEFGRQFDLSLQPIYEAKIKRILSEMINMAEENIEELEVYFKKLVDLIKLVENKDFFKDIQHLEIPSRKIMKLFLNEILKHMNEEEDTECIEEIKEQQLRLKTLDLIDPYECNMDWQRFVHHPNIVKLCSSFMKTDILTACLIFKRHSASLIRQLDISDIRKLMNLIPANIEAFHLIQWLRHFVPTTIHAYPNLMSYIIDWSITKVRSLQFSNHWPEIGLEFSTKIAEIFDDINFLHSDVRRQHETNLERLRELVNALQDLVVLKNSYNLVFTLDNYTKASLDETAYRILQNVQITNLKNLVNNFLYPIYMERGQSPTKAIQKYIKFLVASRQSQSSWLNRAVACIELFHNEDVRLECALHILQAAPVPWPETVSPILKLGNSTHALAQKINTEYEIQNIKIIKVKYGWPADSTDSSMKLIFRILKSDLPDMIDDINDLTKAAPEIQGSANFYCCYELARKGKLDMALRFFKSLRDEQKSECSEKIINIIYEVLEDTGLDECSHGNLFEFFKLISSQSSKSDQEMLQQIQNCYVLKKKFNMNASTRDLKKHEVQQSLLVQGINNLYGALTKAVKKLTTIWQDICDLSIALNYDKIYGIFCLCKHANDIHLSCGLAYYSMELIDCTNLNADKFTDLALLLISQQIRSYQRMQEMSPGMNEDPLAFPIAHRLLIKALEHENTYQMEIIELLKWVHILNSLYGVKALEEFYTDENAVNDLIFKYINNTANPDQKSKKLESNRRNSVSVFDEVVCKSEQQKNNKDVGDRALAVQCVSLSLLLVILEISPNFNTILKLRSFIGSEDIDLKRLKEDFFASLEQLLKSKLHNTWFAVVQYLLELQNKSDVIIIHADLVTLQIRRVFRYLLSQKDPKFLELFAMLIVSEQPRTMLDSLSYDLKSDHQKINLLILAEMFNIHMEDITKVKSIRESRIKLFYFSELCKQDATLKLKSDIDIVSMGQLMKELRNNVLDVRLLERLSKDFGWDYQQVLVSQIIAVLQLQEPVFETKTDAFGKEELVMKSSVEEIKNLCKPYLNEIKNTELFATKLLHFMTEINSYFYEHYLCVIDFLNSVNALPKEMQLWTCILVFLKHKMTSRRKNRPTQMEVDWWLKSHSEIGVLPKISKYRLPFMPIVQNPLKDILDNEVTVDNCESWFPLIKMHTVLQAGSSHTDVIKMQDYFCMSAVKNSISEYKSNNESDKWHLQPTNNGFLQSILRLVEHVSNTSKVLLILYFVASHSPEGADQIEALYECYKFALKHEEELVNQDKAVDTIQKIKRKYPILKTQHLLHVYGLIEDKLIQMVENPKDLIYCLYYHDVILKPTKPDINKVCREIAELHNLDIDLMQFNLLQKWLTFTAVCSEASTLEETFYEDQLSSNYMTETKCSENVIRAHYILKSWNTEKAMQFLVGHIFPADGSVNTSKQLQMYECFSQLNDGNSNYKDLLSQQKYIVIKCVHDLKQLGYNFSLEKFADYDKITILKKIWQSHVNNPFAMEVIANICLGFQIYVPKIWNGVLKQMVKFKMIQQLNSLVDVLSCNSKVFNTEGLVKAWDFVLKIPFKKANKTRSFKQEEMLVKTLFRIQGCPLVSDINLTEIAEDCIRIDRPHLASILIAFCNCPNQRECIKTIVSSRKTANLRSEILDLEECGILPVITNFVLKELNI